MPKRKREVEIEDQISQIADQALRIRVSRLKARFEHGVSQLTAQLRLARGFDRQKMTRRLKQAGSDQAKIERLNAEIQFLKDIKEPKVARIYLVKQCARTKRIAESEAFVALFGTDPETKVKGKAGAVSVAESNVLGRLFKVEAVSKVLPEIMKGIREVLGVDKPVQAGEVIVNSEEDAKIKTNDKSGSEDDFTGFSDQSDQAVVSSGLSGSKETPNDEFSDASDDESLADYDDRLAASSDEDEDEDEEVGASLNGQDLDRLNDMEITTDEEAESEVEIEIPSEDDVKSLKPVQAPTTSTAFLPSLMHGGYYSGSDSEGDPDPDASFATLNKPERKNRRGQKARQAIAEKKFGARAKHLVKANGAEGVHGDRQRLIQAQARNDGWDARKGAVSATDRKPGRIKEKSASKAPNRFERRNGFAKAKDSGKRVKLETSSEKPRPVRTVVKTGEKLHPSWEAARKKKIESANAGAGSFAGKKITFD